MSDDIRRACRAVSWVVLAAALSGLAVIRPAYGGAAEDQLLSCMRGNIPPTLRIQEFQLSAIDRKGERRVMSGKLFAKREGELLRAMLKLTAPSDISGASYLIREGVKSDEMYVFLPALNRTRRIVGGAGDGPLFGTDLSYADIKQVQNAFSGSAPKIEARQQLDAKPVTVIGAVPTVESGSRYSRVRAWIDDASCVAVKVEFYEGTVVRKRLLAAPGSLAKAGRYWYLKDSTMSDLKLGTRTQLTITGVKSGEEVANRYFDSRNFHLGN